MPKDVVTRNKEESSPLPNQWWIHARTKKTCQFSSFTEMGGEMSLTLHFSCPRVLWNNALRGEIPASRMHDKMACSCSCVQNNPLKHAASWNAYFQVKGNVYNLMVIWIIPKFHILHVWGPISTSVCKETKHF